MLCEDQPLSVRFPRAICKHREAVDDEIRSNAQKSNRKSRQKSSTTIDAEQRQELAAVG